MIAALIAPWLGEADARSFRAWSSSLDLAPVDEMSSRILNKRASTRCTLASMAGSGISKAKLEMAPAV
jgi:hypothetical protein